MTEPLRILIVEDVETDAEIAVAELRRAGFNVAPHRVENGPGLVEALQRFAPDVVLSDYQMPGFSGLEALRLTLERAPLLPFIIYTGSINEETAVECMKAGAWDYVLKDRLSRLPLAVAGALERARERVERARADRALRASEERLRESEARYRGLVETSFDWIWEVDAAGCYTYASPRVVDILGYFPEELLGRTPFDLMPEAEAARVGEAFGEIAVRRAPFTLLENLNRHKDGRMVLLETSGVPVFSQEGTFQGYRGTDRDVTERRRAEDEQRLLQQQLNQAQKLEAVGRLAAGIAHDFNNLLQAIMSEVAVFRQRMPLDPAQTGTLDDLSSLVRRGAGLTRQLLLFSRQQVVQTEPLDLAEVVLGATAMLRRLVRENVLIATELGDEPLLLRADRGQLEQVLMNLVVNASDAMPEGGKVTVRAGCDAAALWLAVADTGPGIPESVQPHLFEPFVTTKAPGKGTGLGLSVVHGIVTAHGGAIEVASGPGRGATFTIRLPRTATTTPVSPSQAVPAAADGDGKGDGAGERVLVVEDEEGARQGLATLLGLFGYEVRAVGSAAEARALASERSFDVVLTDLLLPDGRGDALAADLMVFWPGARVVMMSGYTEDDATERHLSGVAVGFLQKPFDADTLATAIRTALARGGRASGTEGKA